LEHWKVQIWKKVSGRIRIRIKVMRIRNFVRIVHNVSIRNLRLVGYKIINSDLMRLRIILSCLIDTKPVNDVIHNKD
jgi:hypothetical protein